MVRRSDLAKQELEFPIPVLKNDKIQSNVPTGTTK